MTLAMWAILSSFGTGLCLALGRGSQNEVCLDAGESRLVDSRAAVPGKIADSTLGGVVVRSSGGGFGALSEARSG
jgi:hypothetical protein